MLRSRTSIHNWGVAGYRGSVSLGNNCGRAHFATGHFVCFCITLALRARRSTLKHKNKLFISIQHYIDQRTMSTNLRASNQRTPEKQQLHPRGPRGYLQTQEIRPRLAWNIVGTLETQSTPDAVDQIPVVSISVNIKHVHP